MKSSKCSRASLRQDGPSAGSFRTAAGQSAAGQIQNLLKTDGSERLKGEPVGFGETLAVLNLDIVVIKKELPKKN